MCLVQYVLLEVDEPDAKFWLPHMVRTASDVLSDPSLDLDVSDQRVSAQAQAFSSFRFYIDLRAWKET